MSKIVTTVPFTMGHTDKHLYIASFPEQVKVEDGPHAIPQKQRILDHLRTELRVLAVKPQEVHNYMCYRNCFKWQNREHVDFCLQSKCGNPGFEAAAAHLGLLKK